MEKIFRSAGERSFRILSAYIDALYPSDFLLNIKNNGCPGRGWKKGRGTTAGRNRNECSIAGGSIKSFFADNICGTGGSGVLYLHEPSTRSIDLVGEPDSKPVHTLLRKAEARFPEPPRFSSPNMVVHPRNDARPIRAIPMSGTVGFSRQSLYRHMANIFHHLLHQQPSTGRGTGNQGRLTGDSRSS